MGRRGDEEDMGMGGREWMGRRGDEEDRGWGEERGWGGEGMRRRGDEEERGWGEEDIRAEVVGLGRDNGRGWNGN